MSRGTISALGTRHRGKSIVLFIANRQIRIVDADGELLRAAKVRHTAGAGGAYVESEG